MSIEQRHSRMVKIQNEWGLTLPHPLMAQWKIPDHLFSGFRTSVALYVARALHLNDVPLLDDDITVLLVESVDLQNVTPNGAIVPKTEYQTEYNLVLQYWSAICRTMVGPSPRLLSKFRITPNIRIKFGTEQAANLGRPLNTGIPHSDAWVEGPWGLNCFMPIIGDVRKNSLLYFETQSFDEEFLVNSESYLSMQWVLDKYMPIPNLRAKAGYVTLTDYALIHRTELSHGCGARISIDTTVMVGDHEILMARKAEYVSTIPEFGTKSMILCHRSEHDSFKLEKSAFEHYTNNSIELIDIGSAAKHKP